MSISVGCSLLPRGQQCVSPVNVGQSVPLVTCKHAVN